MVKSKSPSGRKRVTRASSPTGWEFDARSELRQQLASTFGRFTVDHLWVGPIIPRPMARRQQRPS